MNDTIEKPRLQQLAPSFEPLRGDNVLSGFERAMREATDRARHTGLRQLVTCARYCTGLQGEPMMRVQAWR